MKTSKEFKVLMGVYVGAGILSGVIFSKARQHKLLVEAREDIANDLKKVSEETKACSESHNEES